MVQLRAAVLTVFVAVPMAGLGCTTTPVREVLLSRETCEVLKALRLGRGVVTLKGGTDRWLIMANPDAMVVSILRVPAVGDMSSVVGPEYRHVTSVLTDGDAADVYLRVTGKVHSTLQGELSEEYRGLVKGRR